MFLNSGPSLKKLKKNQLKAVTGLLTGHCHFKGHLQKWGSVDIPICKRHQNSNGTALHTLCYIATPLPNSGTITCWTPVPNTRYYCMELWNRSQLVTIQGQL